MTDRVYSRFHCDRNFLRRVRVRKRTKAASGLLAASKRRVLLTRRWVTPYNNSIFQISESRERRQGRRNIKRNYRMFNILAGCKFAAVACPFVVAIGKPRSLISPPAITSGVSIVYDYFLAEARGDWRRGKKMRVRFLRVSACFASRRLLYCGYARPSRPHLLARTLFSRVLSKWALMRKNKTAPSAKNFSYLCVISRF